jgi:hypothetical protein
MALMFTGQQFARVGNLQETPMASVNFGDRSDDPTMISTMPSTVPANVA